MNEQPPAKATPILDGILDELAREMEHPVSSVPQEPVAKDKSFLWWGYCLGCTAGQGAHHDPHCPLVAMIKGEAVSRYGSLTTQCGPPREGMAEQLRASLDLEWLVLNHGDRDSLLHHWDNSLTELAAAAVERDVRSVLSAVMASAGSPIEQAMLVALGMVAYHRGFQACYCLDVGGDERVYTTLTGRAQPSILEQPSAVFFITPQYKINAYRVDIAVSLVPEPDTASAVIVECDGHDFHERTREQAARDKKRLRDLQALGFVVFPFTGSDVFRDPYACALEVWWAALMRYKPADRREGVREHERGDGS